MGKTFTSSRFGFVAIAAAILSVAGPAVAAPVSPGDVPSVKVYLTGIDISTPEGLAMAKGKVRVAARSVCPNEFGTLDLMQQTAAADCYRKAVSDADGQIAQRVEHLASHNDASVQTALVVSSATGLDR